MFWYEKQKGLENIFKTLDFILEAASRFELENNGFAGRFI